MSNYRKRVDANQARIVAALRKAGASVQHLHSIGHGCPDLLIGWKGWNLVAEVKDGSQPPSKRKLTSDECKWHQDWNGTVEVVASPEDAVRLLNLYEQ